MRNVNCEGLTWAMVGANSTQAIRQSSSTSMSCIGYSCFSNRNWGATRMTSNADGFDPFEDFRKRTTCLPATAPNELRSATLGENTSYPGLHENAT